MNWILLVTFLNLPVPNTAAYITGGNKLVFVSESECMEKLNQVQPAFKRDEKLLGSAVTLKCVDESKL
ncbi:hypothetical protein [Herbaspirillum sp. RV1423]|uniref:hypothetical protein n=1 Tax=Herbaspirillum sp. RV1423 TaxID=1443993 RepID=UPI000551630F|nr:hypothetical protein [Herbaspirillum sp. RV1423]